jgi:hypothetical protein
LVLTLIIAALVLSQSWEHGKTKANGEEYYSHRFVPKKWGQPVLHLRQLNLGPYLNQ